MAENVFAKPPAYGRIADWLGSQLLQRLLDHAQSEQDNFRVSGVGGSGGKRVDLTRRRSSKLKLSGELRDELQARARGALPQMLQQLGATPFEPGKFELEMVAHGDGAFYVRHRDVVFVQSGPTNRRVISAVYYFHRMPKSFSGGVLRIYSLEQSSEIGAFVDIEPTNDTLVFFPSWFPHEVMPVTCPSNRFEDSRFAINCWIHR